MHECRHTFKAMGSPCQLHLFHPDLSLLERAIDVATAEVKRLEEKYSRFLNDSVLTQINQQSGIAATVVDAETVGLLNYAQNCFYLSEGLFDITSGVFRQVWDFNSNALPTEKQLTDVLPFVGFEKLNWDGEQLFLPKGMQIDFGGIVKEYAADCAREHLIRLGLQHGLVDLGGDMALLGSKPNNAPWLIGIRNPHDPEQAIATISLSHGAIATSGYYERFMMVNGKRYCHIINPKTGWPVHYVASVSVAANSCLVSGSLSSIAMLKQQTAVAWLNEQQTNFYLHTHQGEDFGTLGP